MEPKFEFGLTGKASLEVKAEIPSQSLGRLLDSLTDIIRPFSESRGLKADLIRLQRQEVALDIVRLATRQIEDAGAEIKPLPTKALVAILEKGSLEEPNDDELIRRWANLLASASLNYDSDIMTFASILSEIGPHEAMILKYIFDHPKATKSNFGERSNELLADRSEIISKTLSPGPDVKAADEVFSECFTTIGFIEGANQKYTKKRYYNDRYYQNEFRYQILERLFILQWDSIVIDDFRFHFVGLTGLGKKFIARVESPLRT